MWKRMIRFWRPVWLNQGTPDLGQMQRGSVHGGMGNPGRRQEHPLSLEGWH